jgi:hypothetical protein
MLRSFAFAIALLSLIDRTFVAADQGKALGKFVILVEKQEVVLSHPRILPRLPQTVAQAVCSPVCSVLDSAANTCAGDACFCPVLTAVGTPCSQCYASVNITAAELLASAFSICASEFSGAGGATTTQNLIFSTSTASTSAFVGLAAACKSQCNLINSALSLCTDDFCFCPTALAAGSACSSCLMTADISQGTQLGSAIYICQTEFSAGTAASTTKSLALPFALGLTTSTVTNHPGTIPTTATTASTSSQGGLSGGAIGGIVGGIMGVIAIGAVAIFVLLRRGSTREPRANADQYQSNQPRPAAPQQVSNYTEKVEPQPQFAPVEPIQDEIPSGGLRYLDPDQTAEYGGSEPISGRTARNY